MANGVKSKAVDVAVGQVFETRYGDRFRRVDGGAVFPRGVVGQFLTENGELRWVGGEEPVLAHFAPDEEVTVPR